MSEERSFALCLTHDVDRPYKTYQSGYYALKEHDLYHLKTALPGVNPYWQFEEIMALEDDLGVRSAFYFLCEQQLFRDRPVRDWLRPTAWTRYLGRYAIDAPEIVSIIHDLDIGGWEVGLHGSYESYRDRERLRAEKAVVEEVLGHGLVGGRQHYLNLAPETWRYHRDVGLRYDCSLGSSTEYGFQHGYDPLRPFNDEFVVFPLTLMDNALPDVSTGFERAWTECERLLEEAQESDAVMTVLWHPRCFSESDFPGYRALYRRIVERALELGAWIGPPGDFYEMLDGPNMARNERDAQSNDAATPRDGALSDVTETSGGRP